MVEGIQDWNKKLGFVPIFQSIILDFLFMTSSPPNSKETLNKIF